MPAVLNLLASGRQGNGRAIDEAKSKSMPPPPPGSEAAARDISAQHGNNNTNSTTSSFAIPDHSSRWQFEPFDLRDEADWVEYPLLTQPRFNFTPHVAQDDEDDEDGDEDMPDIQRGSVFDATQAGDTSTNPPSGQSVSQRDDTLTSEPRSASQSTRHRAAYNDPNSFIYGDSTWSSDLSSITAARRQNILQTGSSESNRSSNAHSLRRTVGLSSTLRNRRSELQSRSPRVQFPINVNPGSSVRNRSTSPDVRPATTSQREGSATPIPSGGMDLDERSSEYAGWAPGTMISENQRTILNDMRALVRENRNNTSTPAPAESHVGGRSAALTALERRYWDEQDRQRRSRLHAQREAELVARRMRAREGVWPTPAIVDINGNQIDTGANNEYPNPRSIIYRPPTLPDTIPSRRDTYDGHRDLEEPQDDTNEAVASNRRARRELQRARRIHPLDEVRRDDLRRGLYDLHRDRHSDLLGLGETTRQCVEGAIKYLEKLRDCTSSEQAYRVAEEGGLIRHGRSACDLADFMFDLSTVKKTPWTSWLVPGTRFSGFQHAVQSTALPYVVASHSAIRTRNPTEHPHVSRIPTATASSNPNSSNFRPSWIESVIQRDRHTGASPNNSSTLTGATLPSSTNSSLLYAQATSLSHGRNEHEDTWPVKVTITSIDYEKCTLTGTMEAMNVPNKGPSGSSYVASQPNVTGGSSQEQTTITTFLEGEIIDLTQHSLETCGFNADSVVDSTYWRRLEPFKSLSDKDVPSKLVSSEWLRSKIGHEWVLMRWKEKCFVTPSDAGMGLTIYGFYYISLQRETGKIEGLYYDPQSSPYQHLMLEPTRSRQFSTYTFQ